jgi:hypothetical protein
MQPLSGANVAKILSGHFSGGVFRFRKFDKTMPVRLILSLFAAAAVLAGCAAGAKKPAPKPPGETAFKKLDVAGVKLGDGKGVLHKFGSAKKSALSGGGREVYEIYKPNAYISMLVLTFQDGRVRKMELRYFRGPTEHTYATAGGWEGLRDYLTKRFGPPTKTGYPVPQLSDLHLNAGYSKFNGEWLFPKADRRIHLIALADSNGGVAAVTFLDTSAKKAAPAAPPGAPATTAASGPNPGF